MMNVNTTHYESITRFGLYLGLLQEWCELRYSLKAEEIFSDICPEWIEASIAAGNSPRLVIRDSAYNQLIHYRTHEGSLRPEQEEKAQMLAQQLERLEGNWS